MGIISFFRNKNKAGKKDNIDNTFKNNEKEEPKSNSKDINELSIEELLRSLPLKQKYAFMSMVYYFQGYCIGSPKTDVINRAVMQIANMLNVPIKESMDYAENEYNSITSLTQELKTLPKRAKSVLLGVCCTLCVFDTKGGSDDAVCTIFSELGFTSQEISLIALDKVAKFYG